MQRLWTVLLCAGIILPVSATAIPWHSLTFDRQAKNTYEQLGEDGVQAIPEGPFIDADVSAEILKDFERSGMGMDTIEDSLPLLVMIGTHQHAKAIEDGDVGVSVGLLNLRVGEKRLCAKTVRMWSGVRAKLQVIAEAHRIIMNDTEAAKIVEVATDPADEDEADPVDRAQQIVAAALTGYVCLEL